MDETCHSGEAVCYQREEWFWTDGAIGCSACQRILLPVTLNNEFGPTDRNSLEPVTQLQHDNTMTSLVLYTRTQIVQGGYSVMGLLAMSRHPALSGRRIIEYFYNNGNSFNFIHLEPREEQNFGPVSVQPNPCPAGTTNWRMIPIVCRLGCVSHLHQFEALFIVSSFVPSRQVG